MSNRLEQAYEAIWQRHVTGLPPQDIVVPTAAPTPSARVGEPRLHESPGCAVKRVTNTPM
ncbi:MAG: hypothetical protein IH898_13320 [Planctomycetes bacterium]|nr:hypothetical protein [Planctomycetota bacterium]